MNFISTLYIPRKQQQSKKSSVLATSFLRLLISHIFLPNDVIPVRTEYSLAFQFKVGGAPSLVQRSPLVVLDYQDSALSGAQNEKDEMVLYG